MGMRVGYARVSSVGQKLDVQLDKLADCERIYQKKVSAGSKKLRLELQRALDFVRDEDVFVVTKLDRLARSVVDLSIIVQRLEEKHVDLDQGIDTTTIYGRLQFNILASIGEFERGLIRERSREGREKAISRGVKFGAKPKLSKAEIDQLIRDFEVPGCIKAEIAEHYGISRSSVYRLYAENRQEVSEI